jgi:diguanylate cyclase (GGDEF)-like protein/PAS domain S-box-containing protein
LIGSHDANDTQKILELSKTLSKIVSMKASGMTNSLSPQVHSTHEDFGSQDLLPPELPIPVRLASLESTFHSAPIGLCTVDLNFRYISVNERFARMYDKSPAHFIGRTVSEAMPEPAAQIIAHYKIALETQQIVEREIQVQRSGPHPDDPPRQLTYLRTAQPVRDPAGTIVGISVALLDVTSRREAENALRDSEENLRYTVELTPHIPWNANALGEMTFISPLWYQVTGIQPTPAILRNWIQGLHRDDRKPTLDLWKRSVATGDTFDIDYRIRCLGGEWRWHRARAYPRRNERAEIVSWYGTVEDIHDRKLAEEALRAKTLRLEEITETLAQLAREDHLTGLANRRTFDDILGKEVERSRRAQLPLALILADVDHFKRFNDTYGHPAGDDVLRAVAKAIERVLRRPGDLASRFGGEEFAIILPNTTSDGAIIIAERARLAVDSLVFNHPDTGPHGVTISLGVAMLNASQEAGESKEGIAAGFVATVDKALYRAKAAGRNCIIMA